MPSLFLASKISGTVDLCIRTFGLDPRRTRITHVPTAQNCFVPKPSAHEQSSYTVFAERGYQVQILDLEVTETNDVEKILNETDVLVVGGGNTFYLLQWCQKRNFFPIVRTFLDRGGIYVGSSAGSCIIGPDIAYAESAEDDPSTAPDLHGTAGMGLIDVRIYPHCIEEWYTATYTDAYVRRALTDMDTKIFLRDHQALLVRDGWYRIVNNTQ